MLDPGGTTGVMDLEWSFRRTELSKACRIASRFGPGWFPGQTLPVSSGFSPDATGNLMWSEEVRPHPYRPSIRMSKGPKEAQFMTWLTTPSHT